MKRGKVISSFGVLLLLGLILTSVVSAQGGIEESGLGDSPADGMEAVYLFTGVYNKETLPTDDTEFATAVHCTNIGQSSVNVKVQFFAEVGGIPATASAWIASSSTKSFSTQAIASWGNLNVANTGGVEIQHGSGWVRAAAGSQIICTAQVLALYGIDDVLSDITQLHLFDKYGNLIDPDNDRDNDIFLPTILKAS